MALLNGRGPACAALHPQARAQGVVALLGVMEQAHGGGNLELLLKSCTAIATLAARTADSAAMVAAALGGARLDWLACAALPLQFPAFDPPPPSPLADAIYPHHRPSFLRSPLATLRFLASWRFRHMA